MNDILRLIKQSGGIPNNRIRRVSRALQELERLASLPIQPVEFKEYLVTLTNGKEIKVTIPKDVNILSYTKEKGYQVYSFSRI